MTRARKRADDCSCSRGGSAAFCECNAERTSAHIPASGRTLTPDSSARIAAAALDELEHYAAQVFASLPTGTVVELRDAPSPPKGWAVFTVRR